MSVRALTWAALLAAAALVPARAGAFGWIGRIGLEYGRDDTWSAVGDRTTAPHLDLNLALDAAGYLSAPDVVTYGGAVDYRRVSNSIDGESASETVRDYLTYRLRTAFFPSPKSPFTLSVLAERRQDDFELPGFSAVDRTITWTYGAEASTQAPNRPYLRVGYRRDESEEEGPAVGLATRTVDHFTASTGFGSGVYSYSASYRGNLSEGTFATDNKDDHRVDASASVDVAKDLRLRLSDTFYLRVPTLESVFNPRQEQNSLVGSLEYREGFARFHIGRYQYTRALQTAPGVPEIEREQQRLGYSLQTPLSPEWRIRGDVDVTHSRGRVGTDEEQAEGQTLGATVYWRRQTPAHFVEVRGGPRGGLLEPAGADLEYGYGGTAGASVGQTWGEVDGQLSYDLTYQSDLVGNDAQSFQQLLSASLNGRVGTGVAHGQLLASAERRLSRLFGDGASRAITAVGGYARGHWDAELRLGLRDGIVGSISESVSGDGLFLPAPYNSHVLFASLTGNARLTRYLSARALVRRTSQDLPDRPTLDETEARATLVFTYGALGFALEDRYVVSESLAGTGKFNQVWIRAYRVFGSRY